MALQGVICMQHHKMHDKLREQWSDGSAEKQKPAAQNLFRRKRALSTSCPALDASAELSSAPSSIDNSKLQIAEESDGTLYRSMLNLSCIDSMAPVSPTSPCAVLGAQCDGRSPSDPLCSRSPFPEISVQICINDVSVDNPEDFQTVSGDEDEHNLELIRRQKRRSSWCPEKERKRDEKEEKQRMLGVNGRSQSLSSLEGQDDSDESDDDSADVLPVPPSHSLIKSYAAKTPGTVLTNGDLTGGADDAAYTGSSNTRFQKRTSDPSQLQAQLAECSFLSDGGADAAIDRDNETDDNSFNNKVNFTGRNRCQDGVGASILKAELDQTTECSYNDLNDPLISHVQHVEDCTSEDVSYTSKCKAERSGSHADIFFPKEEKTRRRSSVFSKISGYRQNKKTSKGPKLNYNDHKFVSVSVSNSTLCDVCGKFLSNKPALQCENCAVNVHESSCFGQMLPCSRNNRLLIKENSVVLQKDFNRNEEESADAVDSFVKSGLGSIQGNSHSTESLDDSSMAFGDLDEETEMLMTEEMAEAWSVTVDKRTLKKMTAKDIKRQDHIWELIQTERNHFRTLKKMQKIFAQGMIREVGLGKDCVEQIFPRLDDLLDVHSNLLRKFFDRQLRHCDQSIEHIGDLLVEVFEGRLGDQMKSVYGEFCSRHSEAVRTFKELRRTDRKFQAFLDKCSRLNICQRQGLDECILLVTQRLTKYPLLIEAIAKTTIDVGEKEHLTKSLIMIKDIIRSVDSQVDAFFKRQRFVDILNRLDQKSSTIYRGTKFKKFELLVSERKLHFEGYLKWMSARGKSTEVLAVVLSDILFFLIESNQKYHFFSQDGKSSVVSLSKLLVREKDGMRDSRGFYLICSSDDPEMYELVCKSPEERCHWIAQLKDAIVKCCHEDSGRHELSAQDSIYLNKSSSLEIQQLLDLVQEKDSMISSAYKERTEVILEVLQMIAKNDYSSMNHKIEDKKLFNSSCLISAILQLENRLLVAVKQINAIAGQQEADFGSLSNGVLVTTLPKKRADTFSGFEYRDKESAKNLTERRQNVSEDHCRQQSQNESLSSGKLQHDLRNHRRGSLIIATDQTESHRTNSNGADKSNRRMSVNLIPNVLNKLHRDKESTRTTAGSTGKSDEGSTSSVPQVSPLRIEWLSTLVTDECESLAQLALHIHSLLDFLSDQSSEMQNLRLELNRMNQNVTKLYEENDRLLADRKLSGLHHDKQLEELRSLQGSMERQKKELVKLRENHEAEMQKERHELEKKQSDIEKQKAELNLQKELLKQEKDFLQRQCDLFEEQRIDVLRLRHNSNDSVRSNPCSSFHDLNSATTRSPKCAESQDKVSEIPNRGNFVTGPSNNPKDLKLGLERYRNLFTKDSGAGSKPHRMSSTVQQILPMKLSTGSSPSRGGRLPHLCSKPDKTHGGMSKNFSEGSIGEGVDHLQSSNSSSSLPFYSALYASRSQPQINFSISAIPSHMKTNVMLPIHLTEKSKSTPVSAHGSPARYLGSCVDFPRAQNSAEKQTEKPPALKESDIIFF